MTPKEAPIGYWIKQADLALSAGIDAVHLSHRLTRTDWQLLNTIAQQPIERADLLDLLKPFADEVAVIDILNRFKTEGWVEVNEENQLSLTGKGYDRYNTCLQDQQAFRQQAMAGITSDAYQTTVATLRQLVENVTVIKG